MRDFERFGIEIDFLSETPSEEHSPTLKWNNIDKTLKSIIIRFV